MADNNSLQLILKMSDLWIRHMRQSHEDDPGPEILEELEELILLREQVVSIYSQSMEIQNQADSMPDQIAQYLKEHEPKLNFEISLFNESPIQYLISSSVPISQTTSDELDERFPDVVVLAIAPI